MDALSQALVSVRAAGAIFFRVQCAAPWGFAVPDIKDAGPLLSPGAARIINYHLITEGRALVQMDDGETFWAESGDIVLLPHGTAHIVSNGQPNEIADSGKALKQVFAGHPATLQLIGDHDGEKTSIVCGFIGCEQIAERLFLSGLPNYLRISLQDGPGDEWLIQSIEQLVSEATIKSPGSSVLLSRMAETLFVEALRRYMRGLPVEETGWLAAARDPMIGSALALLHAEPHFGWTMNELAKRIGSSQSVLLKRFNRLLGETPARYLRRWRLHLGAEMLAKTTLSILHIASGVGYESETAFNRAFKNEYGAPPAQYRRRHIGRAALKPNSNFPAIKQFQ